MNLPYPFDNASGVKANPEGTINLIDQQGKPLAQISLTTAFELSMGAELTECDGGDFGYGIGHGYGVGSGHGHGYGAGFGNHAGRSDGSGFFP